MEHISEAEARRIALAAQGFGEPRSNGRVNLRHLRKVLDRTKLLQIDSVNVLVRSHYLPLFSRLGPYPMDLLDRTAYERRELVEYWGRQASFIPMKMWPLFRTRMERPHPRFAAWAEAESDYVESTYRQVAEHGPLSAGDLENPGPRGGPYWTRTKGKTALEWLFGRGRLSVSHRRNFERYYDLTERVVPPEIFAQRPSDDEAQRGLIAEAAHALGVGTAKDIGGYFGIGVKTARVRIGELVEYGTVVPVQVEGWRQAAYMHTKAKAMRADDVSTLLTPFDPLIWERDRTERLFGFHYRIEIYVPAPKRVHGYYVLPFLMDDELVARVDLKADRKSSALLVQGAFAEPRTNRGDVAARLGEELRSIADWLSLSSIHVRRKGNLSGPLSAAAK